MGIRTITEEWLRKEDQINIIKSGNRLFIKAKQPNSFKQPILTINGSWLKTDYPHKIIIGKSRPAKKRTRTLPAPIKNRHIKWNPVKRRAIAIEHRF